jgi:hypothetical protein
MSESTATVRHLPRWRHLVVAVLVAVVAPALVWIGRSTARPNAPTHVAAARKTAADVPTGKADAVSLSGDIPCTVSPNYTDMPGMSVTFKLGGSASRPVIVLMQGQWFMPHEGVDVRVRLLVDGAVQSGPTEVLVAQRPAGNSLTDGTHGFDFISNSLTPGTHTAKIQWHDNGVNSGCVANRTLIVMHK